MLKKLVRLVSLVQAARHGHGRAAYKPWKGKKWKRHTYGSSYESSSGSGHPAGYGHGYGPQGHGRPHGLKRLLVEAVPRRLLGHR